MTRSVFDSRRAEIRASFPPGYKRRSRSRWPFRFSPLLGMMLGIGIVTAAFAIGNALIALLFRR